MLQLIECNEAYLTRKPRKQKKVQVQQFEEELCAESYPKNVAKSEF